MVNIIENSSVVATVVGSDAVQRKAFGLVLWQWVGLEASMAICRLGIIEGVVLGCTNRNSNSDQQQGHVMNHRAQHHEHHGSIGSNLLQQLQYWLK